jgi:hypothetical protein
VAKDKTTPSDLEREIKKAKRIAYELERDAWLSGTKPLVSNMPISTGKVVLTPLKKRKPQRAPQADPAKRVIAKLYPNGVPDADTTETVKGKIATELEAEGVKPPYPSWKTVNRALGR